MKNRNKNSFFWPSWILIGVVLSGFTQGQGWSPASKEELKNCMASIDRKMKSMDHYQVSITHLSYEDHSSEIVHDRSVGFYRRDRKRYHSSMMGVNTIQNEYLRVVIDSTNKIISIGDPDASLEQQPSPELRDLAFDRCSSILKSEQKSNGKAFKMNFPDSYSLSSCQIAEDENSLLSEIVILYNRKVKNLQHKEVRPKLKIIFSNWKISGEFSENEFSESRYVVKNGSKYQLTGAYVHYKLLDQRFNIK
jgi:hypothetical protein